jgi:hypothetical protein
MGVVREWCRYDAWENECVLWAVHRASRRRYRAPHAGRPGRPPARRQTLSPVAQSRTLRTCAMEPMDDRESKGCFYSRRPPRVSAAVTSICSCAGPRASWLPAGALVVHE